MGADLAVRPGTKKTNRGLCLDRGQTKEMQGKKATSDKKRQREKEKNRDPIGIGVPAVVCIPDKPRNDPVIEFGLEIRRYILPDICLLLGALERSCK